MYVAANFGKETILLLDNPRRLTIDHIAITYEGYYSTGGTTKLRGANGASITRGRRTHRAA